MLEKTHSRRKAGKPYTSPRCGCLKNMSNKNVTGPLFGLLALIFGFVALASFFLRAMPAFAVCLLLCIASLAVFARLRFADFVNFFISRQARYGANVAMSIVGVVGIAVFVNVIVAQRFDKRADLTQLQLYTLSEQTKNVLKTLDKQIQVTAFFSDGDNSQLARESARAKEMLALYENASEFITVSFVNPYIDRILVDKYGIQRDGTTVFENGGRTEKVSTVAEQKFTSAILKLVRNETKKVYFLTGHEERGIDDRTPIGYSEVQAELENQNYAARLFSSLIQPSIPADCAVLVIAGPKAPLTREETRMLTEYLERNGKLLLLLEPSADNANGRLVQLMRKWGVEVRNDLVVDLVHSGVHGPSAPFPEFEQHDITRALQGVGIPFLGTRSVTPAEEIPDGIKVKSLAKTMGETRVSWGETELDGVELTARAYTLGVDTPPPVSIAVAVEQTARAPTENENTRIVVFGDSDFASNAFFRAANRELFVATINWLTLEDDLVAISPIDLQQQTLRQLSAQEAGLVQILSIFFIPVAVFIAGIIVWWQRRGGTA